ncbi:MAG: hypothetical protein J0L87_10215 [Bacteroidetes bacterium]|nr:hypothetical protein [Bacteroidota bacterium]
MEKPNLIETKIAIISVEENGIGFQYFKDNTILDVPEQMENLEAIIKVTGNKPTPFVISAGKNVIITKEARDNALPLESLSPINASAIIVQNLAYRLIAEFFIKVQKPKNPYKIFTDKENAIEWCKQFVIK